MASRRISPCWARLSEEVYPSAPTADGKRLWISSRRWDRFIRRGTLSGNPLAVSAGLATLKQLRMKGVYKKLDQRSAALAKGVGEAAKKAGVSRDANPSRVDVDDVFYAWSCRRLEFGETIRHQAVRSVLSPYVGTGRLSRPVPVRSSFSLHRP